MCDGDDTIIHRASGRVNAKVEPFSPALLSAAILPPWASIIHLQMYSPSPMPLSDFAANFVEPRQYFRVYPDARVLYLHHRLVPCPVHRDGDGPLLCELAGEKGSTFAFTLPLAR